MKRFLALFLAVCMVLGLMACATSSDSGSGTDGAITGKYADYDGFMAGFARADITPKEAVPMASYGNAAQRLSEGLYTYLYINVLAVSYDGEILLFMTIDHSWFSTKIGDPIQKEIGELYGVPADHILLQGTHTHGSVEVGETSIPYMATYNSETIETCVEAAGEAIADLKPAEVYTGSVITENLNFVRRYYTEDGFLTDNYQRGTSSTPISHESEADGEMQLMKFVREGGKDILIANFQAHPHLEGKTLNISYQNVGAFRASIEEMQDCYSIYWQGAAGNLNSTGRLEGEKPYATRDEYGKALATYASNVYNELTKTETGPIQLATNTYSGTVNHQYDSVYNEAKAVSDKFAATNNTSVWKEYAEYGIHSVYHANRIVGNYSKGATYDVPMTVWSFGDVAGVVVPYEMFDVNGMEIKTGSPYEITFIYGYAAPGGIGYIPSGNETEGAYSNGGYEADNSIFVGGTGDELAQTYLDMLGEMHK